MVFGGLLVVLFALLFLSCHSKEPGEEPEPGLTPPMGLVFTLSNAGVSEVAFFNLSSMSIVRTLPLPGYYATISAVSLDATRLIVADGGQFRVGVFDMPSLEEKYVMYLGGRPEDVDADASMSRLFAITHNGSFWVDSMATGGMDTIEVNLHPRRFTLLPPSRSEAWVVTVGDQSLHVIDLQRSVVARSKSFSDAPSDIQFSPDGAKAYIAFMGAAGRITCYATATLDSLWAQPAGRGPFELAMSEDGQYLAASDSTLGSVQIWKLNDGTTWTIPLGGSVSSVAFQRATHTLFALVDEKNQVVRIRMEPGGPQGIDSLQLGTNVRNMVIWERHY